VRESKLIRDNDQVPPDNLTANAKAAASIKPQSTDDGEESQAGNQL